MNAPLAEALRAVYEAFTPYPRPIRPPASLEVGDPASDASTQVKDLLSDQISNFDWWDVSFLDDASAYKHFLPRLLDLAIHNDRYVEATPWSVLDQLIRFKFQDWRTDERTALISLFEQAFLAACAVGADAKGWLCCLASLGQDVTPLLEAVKTSESNQAVIWLALFLTYDVGNLFRDDPAPYWDLVDPPMRRAVGLWFLSPAFQAWLLAHLDTLQEDEHWRIETAFSVRERLTAALGLDAP